jgi:two-component system cell cycle response regulator
MMGENIRVLVVEDNPAYARLIKEVLGESGGFEIEHESGLEAAEARLMQGDLDLLVLDLGLPESRGIETYHRLREAADRIPVVVLSGLDDQQVAMEAVRQGAQDYLVKGRVEDEALSRALRYAVERHRMQEELRQQAIVDDLTGLHNRRGFAAIGEHHLELARRTAKPLTILFADLDGMKTINDTFGHADGDTALRDAADILRRTLRSSDVVARLGGDEFCGLLPACSAEQAAAVCERIQEALREHRGSRAFELSLSLGVVVHEPGSPESFDELLRRADAAMYEQKGARARRS